jgi:DNA-directed RNA polymerase specialized sigma24 family protein
MPYADPQKQREAWRRWNERQRAAAGKDPAARRRAPARARAGQAELPDDCDAWALRELERMSRAEVARRLGITRQAVEQAEKSGLRKLAAMRSAFEGYL